MFNLPTIYYHHLHIHLCKKNFNFFGKERLYLAHIYNIINTQSEYSIRICTFEIKI